MKKGFDNSNKEDNIKGFVNKTEIEKLVKRYKNLKKYQKSSFYEVKKIDGTESIIKNLLDENK